MRDKRVENIITPPWLYAKEIKKKKIKAPRGMLVDKWVMYLGGFHVSRHEDSDKTEKIMDLPDNNSNSWVEVQFG